MAQRKPNRPPPPQPGSMDKISGIVLTDPLCVEPSILCSLLDGQYLRQEICMLEESKIAPRSQKSFMN